MAYQKPLVMVYQEYASTSASAQDTTLFPCIIGPCYHIIDAVEDEARALAGFYSKTGMSNVNFPNNIPGAKIDEASVKFRFKNVYVEMSDSAIDVATIEDNILTFTSGTFPSYVEVGDGIIITDTTTTATEVGVFKVIGTNSSTYTILLNRVPTKGAGTSFTIDVTREMFDVNHTASSTYTTVDAASGTFDITGLKVIVGEEEKFVSRSEVYVGYKALRQDLSTVGMVDNVEEAMGVLGKLDTQDNPLGQAVKITLANTTTPVKFIAVDSDDITGYTAAKDALETTDDVYSLVPLSQDADILTIFKAHADQMSLPENGKWRVAIGSIKMPGESVKQEGSGEVKADGDGDLIILQDSTASFLSNGVDSGHSLCITDGSSVVHEHTVASVLSEDMLTIDPTSAFEGASFQANGTEYTYEIVNVLDKTQQAKAIKEISQSFGTSRFIHVWPDTCVIDGVTLPGYYLGCAVAGATSGLPSHHGFTRLSVAGIGEIKNSGDYFNQAQLNTIAEGGTFIFLQSNPEAAPYIRHQLTTDRSTTEMAEFSFVKNFDYISILCKDVLDQFLGKYNVTPATLGSLETAVRSVLEGLSLYSVAKIGSPVINYDIVSVTQRDDSKTAVEMVVNVQLPYALNTVGLHLISQ